MKKINDTCILAKFISFDILTYRIVGAFTTQMRKYNDKLYAFAESLQPGANATLFLLVIVGEIRAHLSNKRKIATVSGLR